MSTEQSISPSTKTKPCTRCHQDKPLDAYHKNKGAKDGRTTRCKSCAIAVASEWHNANRERAASAKRSKRSANHVCVYTPVTRKVCSRCRTEKEAQDFHSDRGMPDGLNHRCKTCSKTHSLAYHHRYRRIVVERMRIRYWGVRDLRCFARRNDRASNPGKFREQERLVYWKNPERSRLIRKASYYRHRDKRLESNKTPANREKARQYRKANRLRYLALSHRRKARKKSLPNDFTANDMTFALTHWKHRCAACRTPFGLVAKVWWDHWIPLSHPNCTGTIPSNMLPLCDECNNTKSARDAATWLCFRLGMRWEKSLHAIERFFSLTRIVVDSSPSKDTA